MVPTPRRWWSSVPDEQRPAWRAAAKSGVLSAQLADELEAAGSGWFVTPVARSCRPGWPTRSWTWPRHRGDFVVMPRWASSHVGELHGKAGWPVPTHEVMRSRDGRCSVHVGGLAGPSGPGLTWYRIVGPGGRRYL